MPRKPTPGKTSQIKITPDPHKSTPGRPLTSERIAEDLANFRASGGNIEVLGITRVLSPSEEAGPRAAAKAAKSAGRPAKATA